MIRLDYGKKYCHKSPTLDEAPLQQAIPVSYTHLDVYKRQINYYGIVILLRKLRECGIFTEKELRKIAARIAADNGVEVMFFL